MLPHNLDRWEGEGQVTEIDVTMCPDCDQQGTYEARILIGGRGVYTCPEGHRWQDANEKPSNKGLPLTPPQYAESSPSAQGASGEQHPAALPPDGQR